jgi:hypothetical protein
MEPRNEPTAPPPALDRDLVARDLDRLAEVVARLVAKRIPLPIRLALQTRGVSLATMIGGDLRALLDLTDEEAVTLVDAVATELGAWRRVRGPLTSSPELQLAWVRLVEVAGGL